MICAEILNEPGRPAWTVVPQMNVGIVSFKSGVIYSYHSPPTITFLLACTVFCVRAADMV